MNNSESNTGDPPTKFVEENLEKKEKEIEMTRTSNFLKNISISTPEETLQTTRQTLLTDTLSENLREISPRKRLLDNIKLSEETQYSPDTRQEVMSYKNYPKSVKYSGYLSIGLLILLIAVFLAMLILSNVIDIEKYELLMTIVIIILGVIFVSTLVSLCCYHYKLDKIINV